MAAKETLQRLKREPQYVDAVFAAKTNRTKMEEEPMIPVPETEHDIFIKPVPESMEEAVIQEPKTVLQKAFDNDPDFDLSDISHKEKSREDIIAEAEAAAYND